MINNMHCHIERSRLDHEMWMKVIMSTAMVMIGQLEKTSQRLICFRVEASLCGWH